MSDEIAVACPMYSRSVALRQFLDSVPAYVSTAYIADNGPDQDRQVYRESWPFGLEVLHLDHDVGIGACRRAIADAVTEPYLWMGDCDMVITRDDDLRVLREILGAHPDLGGVAGWLLEGDSVRSAAHDCRQVGETVIKDVGDITVTETPYPHARFDFLPHAGLFRTESYNTYTYDPRLQNNEHRDFFHGHQQAGEWAFASTPTVLVRHDKWIDEAYRKQRGQQTADQERLAEKWDAARKAHSEHSDWVEQRGRSLPEQTFDVFRRATPPRVWLPVKRGLEAVIR